jgi:hypothetical protein
MELCAMVFAAATSDSTQLCELTIDRDNWAMTVSPNKDIKIYIGAAAGPLAATSGYVDADTLATYALEMRARFSSFGGIMLWDASWAYGMSLAFHWLAPRQGFHHIFTQRMGTMPHPLSAHCQGVLAGLPTKRTPQSFHQG